MRNTLFATAIALLGLAAVPAKSMPFPPLAGDAPGVTLVAFGCGPGWTRGPYGGCHPMGYARPAYAFVAPAPAYGYAYRPYGYYGRHCWWRGGVRVCN